MVKNTFGGSGHKKFARKHNSSGGNSKLRTSMDEDEIYSIVTKMLGNNMFHCMGVDEVSRLGRIRGKFTGRGKRDNMVCLGGWILVGRREWTNADSTSNKKKIQECDLLEVYSDSNKAHLIDSVHENWINNDTTKIAIRAQDQEIDNEFTFATDKIIERDTLISAINSETTHKINLTINDVEDEDEDEIDVDDI
jgi:hypothetical protein